MAQSSQRVPGQVLLANLDVWWIKLEERPEPNGELEQVQISYTPDRSTMINAPLPTKLTGDLMHFLKENFDLFAWSASDIPGIDPDFMCYRLSIYPKIRLVA